MNQLRKATSTLRVLGLEYFNSDPDADVYCDAINVFQRVRFTKKDGFIAKFTDDMIPYLLELTKDPFVQILFKDLKSLSSAHAMRLLELITVYSRENKGKKTIKTIFSLIELKIQQKMNV